MTHDTEINLLNSYGYIAPAPGWSKTAAERMAIAYESIMRIAMPSLRALRHDLRKEGFEPCGVVLPDDMNPGRYTGDDATDHPATLMGLPISWGSEVALIVRAKDV